MSKDSFRNRLAQRIANAAFRWFADEGYAREVEGLIVYGIRSGARDAREGRDPPPSMEELGLDGSWRRFPASG